MAKYKIGYTQGVYDMFHIGHLNLFNNAKKYCDYLIVGVNTDRLVQAYKNKTPIISETARAEIVKNIKAVDQCILVDTLDKMQVFQRIKFDAIFVGDDWSGNPRWKKTAEEMKRVGVDVVFLPHTDGVSSTDLRPDHALRIKD